MSQVQSLPLNWTNAGTTSDPCDISGLTIQGFNMPATVASATFTVLVSDTMGGTYKELRNANGGAAVTLTMVASGVYALSADYKSILNAFRFFKLKGASSEAAGFSPKAIVEPRLLT